MKNCVVQYYINPKKYSEPGYNSILSNQDRLVEASRKSFEMYCSTHGHDYRFVTQPKLKHKHPTFERFDLWLDESWWDRYEQILYVDTDVFAMRDSPDIFTQSENAHSIKAGWTNKWQGEHCESHYQSLREGILKEFDTAVMKQKGFQPGVFILNKIVVDKMKPFIERFKEFDEDDGKILMWATFSSGVEVTHLDERFNHKRAYFNDAPPVYFFHAAGHKKENHRSRIVSYLARKGLWNK